MGFEVLSSELAFQGKVFDVRVDQVRLEESHEFRVDVVVHADAVTFIPIDQDGAIWFVRQYRHATGIHLLELPAGTLEQGEDPARTAARECREEIGMAPGHLEALGGFYLAPGYSNEYMHVFMATDLTPDALARDPDEIIEIKKLGANDVVSLMREGGFQDAKTLAALQMADSIRGILSQS
jgi:ADP-ribose pyrophosphatase